MLDSHIQVKFLNFVKEILITFIYLFILFPSYPIILYDFHLCCELCLNLLCHNSHVNICVYALATIVGGYTDYTCRFVMIIPYQVKVVNLKVVYQDVIFTANLLTYLL